MPWSSCSYVAGKNKTTFKPSYVYLNSKTSIHCFYKILSRWTCDMNSGLYHYILSLQRKLIQSKPKGTWWKNQSISGNLLKIATILLARKITHFMLLVFFYTPLEAIENQSFSDVFRRYKKWLEDLVAVWCYSRNRDLSLYFNCYITGLQSQ